jgi:hypothetical protein
MTQHEELPMTSGASNNRHRGDTSQEARSRLRERQRTENERLSNVLAAEGRMSNQQAKSEAAVQRALAALAAKQSMYESAIIALIEVSGVKRAAILLDRAESDLNRLVREHRMQKRSARIHQVEAADQGPATDATSPPA